MNITIKITHANGTVMDISIPMLVEQPVKTPPVDTSAVVIPKDDDMASEPAFPAQDAPSTCHEVEPVLSETKSLDANNISLGKEKVGEDEEGAGRIGGVGVWGKGRVREEKVRGKRKTLRSVLCVRTVIIIYRPHFITTSLPRLA